ncbi:P-loop containing nucleoside triphosphate hydrolase protein [Mycena vulgaris]|nr:P-loop containing nucleoside triphosphate hydrolase protein [Mycena vulgaris]
MPPPGSAVVLNIPTSDVYRFGDANRATPVFSDLEWTIKPHESWAVVGTGSGEKSDVFDMLMGHLRIHPPPPPPAGMFPFLSGPADSRDPHDCVSIVSFTNRRVAGGAFYDYTARYGAVREEDRITLRQSMFPETIDDLKSQTRIILDAPPTDHKLFEYLVDKMGLAELLDLPRIALSNGQTRRARILKALVAKPRLLLLDEPLTGLDVENRATVLSILQELHRACDPRIIIGIRMQDVVPHWITHLAVVNDGKVMTGPKDIMLAYQARLNESSEAPDDRAQQLQQPRLADDRGEPVVVMRNVSVTYGPGRKVLSTINWTIRKGQRWHLQGANGSGKTTLLALLTGDHPQSYTQRGDNRYLRLFGVPRQTLATRNLQARIGVVTPELFDAFPRRAPGMSVWDTVATGFDAGFVAPGSDLGALTPAERDRRIARCWEVITALGPPAWAVKGDTDAAEDVARFAQRKFMDLSVGAQRMVLLMRALVGQPPLVLLDEVWSGMDHRMILTARRYLRAGGVGPDQAVVVVTHLDDEVPWSEDDGVVRVLLKDGRINHRR